MGVLKLESPRFFVSKRVGTLVSMPSVSISSEPLEIKPKLSLKLTTEIFSIDYSFCTRYCTVAVDKRVRSTSLYHCRQCGVVLKLCSYHIDYTVVCFVTAAESCENSTSAS